jgi:diaminopimelate epimerase
MPSLGNVNKRLRDVPFVKMTGSGNDFVFMDGRRIDGVLLRQAPYIREICNRHDGIGADGLVILDPLPKEGADDRSLVRISYFNSDGSPADLCGNATLCSTTLAMEFGMASSEAVLLQTPSGRIAGRIVEGLPEISLPAVDSPTTDCNVGRLQGETRIGFASVGIPHLVVLCEDVRLADLASRGPLLRWHVSGGPAGANVNWVSPQTNGTWRYRTFERGVEGETLACGTGAVATAMLLAAWGLSAPPTTLETSSGRSVIVTDGADADGTRWAPRLRGEGRIVFRGTIDELRGSTP